MAAVYQHMEDSGPKPDVLRLVDYIDRFGVQAVMGRATLGAGELRTMTLADNVRRAYWSRASYRDQSGQENWAEWAQKYPEYNEILNLAIMAVDDASDG